jgi:flap endonuclease-1
MGVNLTEIIKSARTIGFEDITGKRIAIDAYNTMYQFISIIRDRFTGEPLRDSKGMVTSHLSGIFYRTSRMLEHKIEPVFVFDGKPPEFKKHTTAARSKVREEARKKWQDAVEKKDYEAVRRYSMQASRLTSDMIAEAKRLLDTMGIPWVQAPSEGEAQAAAMVQKGQAWSTGSQDWDSLMFGTPRFVKNLTITGKRKVPRKEKYIEIVPEIVELDSVLKELGISLDQLIVLGILVGTDYNPGGVKGIGPKKALDLVKQHSSSPLEGAMKTVEWEHEASPQDIFKFFKLPPVEEVKDDDLKPGRINVEALKKVMCDDHEFSEDRIDSTMKKLEKAGVGSGQAKLASFFGK